MRSNSSAAPMVELSAISDDAPPLGASTYSPLAWARKLTLPSPLSMKSNVSQASTTIRLAISGCAPADSAVTIRPSACARSPTVPPDRRHFWLLPPPQDQSWRFCGLPRSASRQRWEATPRIVPSEKKSHCWLVPPAQPSMTTLVPLVVPDPAASRHFVAL